MRVVAAATLLLFACSTEREPTVPASPTAFATIAHGAAVDVAVERALYERPGSPRFFVHVRVTNTTTTEVSVDLRKYHEVFYPNQWGASDTEHRTSIDERRLMLAPLDAASAAAIVAEHRAGLRTRIAARGTLDYYRDFNASGRADIDAQSRSRRFVIVTMDGQLKVSGDMAAERVMAPSDDAPREVALHTPVSWKSIPAGALVLADE